MTPKEKAKQLVEFFKFETKQSEIVNDIILGDISVIFQHHKAKQCALIALEISREFITGDLNESFDKTMYLFEVKQEIEKL